MKKIILAMDAAPAAIPPNPRTAAISAITKKVIVQRIISNNFKVNNIWLMFQI